MYTPYPGYRQLPNPNPNPQPSDVSASVAAATRAPCFWSDKETEFCLLMIKELSMTGSLDWRKHQNAVPFKSVSLVSADIR